jgi:hypothetical protein
LGFSFYKTLDIKSIRLYTISNLTSTGDKPMKAYQVTDISSIPNGALFISINQDNKVNAHFGETWAVGNDVYSTSSSTYLGESFTPVDKTTIIELPLHLDDITDKATPLWASYITVSDSGNVTFWEYEPTKQSNGDDFDSYFYDCHVLNESAGKTKLPYFYQTCYRIIDLL